MALELARRMAFRLPLSVSREDVEGAALLGLTEAASRYDCMRDEPFMAFARRRIRGAVLDYLRRIDHLSRRVRQGTRRVSEVQQRLEQQQGRPVGEDEVAREMGISEAAVRASVMDMRSDQTVSLQECQQPLARETPMECILRHQRRTALVQAMKELDHRSQLILALFYQEGLTLREIGQIVGVTESRVCQLRAKALRDLRTRLTQ